MGWASGLDGKGSSLGQELVKERETPKRLSRGFWLIAG